MKFETIWTQYRTSLKSYLSKRIANSHDVEDLLQDILLKTYQKLDTLKSIDSLKPWLFSIARNSVVDYYRKDKPEFIKEIDDLFNEESECVSSELAECILPFIRALPNEQAELLLAIDINNVNQKDYAKELGIGYSTLKSRVQKSRQLLKKSYDDCCHFHYDHQGNLMEYESKSTTNSRCNN